MKKLLALLALLLAFSAVFYSYFKKQENSASSANLFQSIPSHCPLALESSDWTNLLDKIDTLPLGKFLNEQDWFQGTKANLNFYKSLESILYTEELATSKQQLFAYGNAGNAQLGILMAIEAAQLKSNDQILELLHAAQIEAKTYEFENQLIIILSNFENQEKASLCLFNKVLLISFNQSFVEEAILAMKNDDHDDWEKLADSFTSQQDLNLYVQAKELNYLSSYLMQSSAYEVLNSLEKICDKSLLQIKFYDKNIILSGYSTAGTLSLLDTLKEVQVAENTLALELPSNTAFYRVFSSKDKLGLNSDDYAAKAIHNWMGESFITFTLESYDTNIDNRKALLLSKTQEDDLISLQEIDPSSASVNPEADQLIYKAVIGQTINKALNLKDYCADTLYFSSFSDKVVMSANLSIVEQYINTAKSLSFLRADNAYLDFKKSLSSKSNLEYYFDLALIQSYLTSIFVENKWQSELGKIDIQFSNMGDKIFTQAKVELKNIDQEKSKVLWSYQLDTLANFKPQLVINHNSKAKELITQDLANNLYLMDASGALLWKKPILGQIQGEITQIDYFRNGKLQYVFNTLEHIYVMDRNGEQVDGFPISLPAKACTGLLVVDYDNNGKFRYFVACTNKNIYGYELNGSPLEGWNPRKDVGFVTSPLRHGVFESKDYIYFTNDASNFFAFNRKGEERFSHLSCSAKNFILEKSVFVGGNLGRVESISIEGVLNAKPMLDSSYTHFEKLFSPINNAEAYAFASKRNFKLQASQWKNFASFSTTSDIRFFESVNINKSLWFLIYTQNQVYLVNELGSLHPDFPLDCSGNASLVDFMNGKEKILIYNDLKGNLIVLEPKLAN